MGNFLDTPITDKETEIGEDAGVNLSYGLSAMQGWRAQMEDDHVQMLRLPAPVSRFFIARLSHSSHRHHFTASSVATPTTTRLPSHPPLTLCSQLQEISLFGVYDGHGGDTVAHYVAKHFPRCLLETAKLTPTMKDDEVVPTAKLAFEIALMAIDAEMAQLQEIESGHDQSGSTSVMTLITKSHIVCANTGDSRAVLCRGGEQVPLSHDHKPFNPGEKERIENAGSHVKFNRVNGDLAVSRALGDFVYKRCETVEAEHQAVTAFPGGNSGGPPPAGRVHRIGMRWYMGCHVLTGGM